ncbi:hypothetical protein Metvu_1038 [Methanocaldococcus vulcanius M7]|uniref:Uncharacterized protein n=1 Tax=Methanocaldococcus vulcanius (strain ATCC 700851 / DSM 12094 / M7) TaxID=579137 RepID=C9RH44_METVM|nr:hypothetical protein [Methanocaldococcus vulcanius]ACX72896.1 hypothetical protein Metvu_1038 [Methanocaldococcus vulcanius M7]
MYFVYGEIDDLGAGNQIYYVNRTENKDKNKNNDNRTAIIIILLLIILIVVIVNGIKNNSKK